MDRRFSNATSSLASAALKLCTELARYWRTVLADQGYRPELHYMPRPWPEVARGPRASAQNAIRLRLCQSGWRLESWHCSSASRADSPRTTLCWPWE
jgi:hypothetical protein